MAFTDRESIYRVASALAAGSRQRACRQFHAAWLPTRLPSCSGASACTGCLERKPSFDHTPFLTAVISANTAMTISDDVRLPMGRPDQLAAACSPGNLLIKDVNHIIGGIFPINLSSVIG
jgi:hypothetical protein